jgi:CubicO group peptidase (beta-lactamase class C family)
MKIRAIISILTIASLIIVLCNCDKNEVVEENFDESIKNEMNKYGIPGLSVGIIKNNKLVWDMGYGLAKKEEAVSATKDINYTMMSVCKTVLAVAVMQMVEKGKLNLDEDINTYLPFSIRHKDYPNIPITLRMLLSHTSGLASPDGNSGLGDLYHYYSGDSAPRLSEWIPEYLLPDGSNYLPEIWENTKPGETFKYSNIGTSLAAYIIELIEQLEYTEYCKEYIFIPLEMNNTSFWLSDIDISQVASMYDNSGNLTESYSLKLYAVGGLKSSVEEFSHLIIMMMNEGIYNGNKVLEKSSVEEILTVQNEDISDICLVWLQSKGDTYLHDGGEKGGSTMAEFKLESKVGFIILSNKYNSAVYPGGTIYNLIKKKTEEIN